MSLEVVAGLQEIIAYTFEDTSLLCAALTHRSYLNEVEEVIPDNQRLEFLGDSVLGLVIASDLYARFPEAHEGQLSTMLAQMVCEPSLAERAREIDLGSFLRLGRGEEKSGGRSRASLLADAYEALLGAIFLDGGMQEAERVILQLFQNQLASCRVREHAPTDFKSRLQKLVQGAKLEAPRYRIADENGPDHEKLFVAEVLVDGEAVGSGEGRSKKEAEQRAAERALKALGNKSVESV